MILGDRTCGNGDTRRQDLAAMAILGRQDLAAMAILGRQDLAAMAILGSNLSPAGQCGSSGMEVAEGTARNSAETVARSGGSSRLAGSRGSLVSNECNHLEFGAGAGAVESRSSTESHLEFGAGAGAVESRRRRSSTESHLEFGAGAGAVESRRRRSSTESHLEFGAGAGAVESRRRRSSTESHLGRRESSLLSVMNVTTWNLELEQEQ